MRADAGAGVVNSDELPTIRGMKQNLVSVPSNLCSGKVLCGPALGAKIYLCCTRDGGWPDRHV